MKNSHPNRLFSALVAFLVFAGATLPSGLHQKDTMMKMCEKMESHPMTHNECDFGIACACSIEQAPVKTQSKVVKAPVVIKVTFTGFFIFAEGEEFKPQKSFKPFTSELVEASPPIFLKNSTFLN